MEFSVYHNELADDGFPPFQQRNYSFNDNSLPDDLKFSDNNLGQLNKNPETLNLASQPIDEKEWPDIVNIFDKNLCSEENMDIEDNIYKAKSQNESLSFPSYFESNNSSLLIEENYTLTKQKSDMNISLTMTQSKMFKTKKRIRQDNINSAINTAFSKGIIEGSNILSKSIFPEGKCRIKFRLVEYNAKRITKEKFEMKIEDYLSQDTSGEDPERNKNTLERLKKNQNFQKNITFNLFLNTTLKEFYEIVFLNKFKDLGENIETSFWKNFTSPSIEKLKNEYDIPLIAYKNYMQNLI